VPANFLEQDRSWKVNCRPDFQEIPFIIANSAAYFYVHKVMSWARRSQSISLHPVS
jgi:hypothetical protein